MQDNFNTYSLIQDYLNNKLSNEKRIAFEKELSTNQELQRLVEDYSLADKVMEQNEILKVNETLSQIHAKSILRKKVIKAGLVISLLILSVVTVILIQKSENKVPKLAIAKDRIKSFEFIAEPTPFTIIDSMSEVSLSSAIKKSKKEVIVTMIEPDTVIKEVTQVIIPEEKINQDTAKIITQKTVKPLDQDTIQKPKKDSIVKIPCAVLLTSEFITLTASCNEKRTGSILFTSSGTDYSYSINNKESYSSNPYFNYLDGGYYSVSIKKGECESEMIEVVIESYQCNYVIHPERMIFFEKSLDKFQDENTVEVLIFNRNGSLVYNKTIPTYEDFTWDGNSNTNIPTPMGNYTYLIKSGKKISNGEITIIR